MVNLNLHVEIIVDIDLYPSCFPYVEKIMKKWYEIIIEEWRNNMKKNNICIFLIHECKYIHNVSTHVRTGRKHLNNFNKLSALSENLHTLNFRHVTHVVIRRNPMKFWELMTSYDLDNASQRSPLYKVGNSNPWSRFSGGFFFLMKRASCTWQGILPLLRPKLWCLPNQHDQ